MHVQGGTKKGELSLVGAKVQKLLDPRADPAKDEAVALKMRCGDGSVLRLLPCPPDTATMDDWYNSFNGAQKGLKAEVALDSFLSARTSGVLDADAAQLNSPNVVRSRRNSTLGDSLRRLVPTRERRASSVSGRSDRNRANSVDDESGALSLDTFSSAESSTAPQSLAGSPRNPDDASPRAASTGALFASRTHFAEMRYSASAPSSPNNPRKVTFSGDPSPTPTHINQRNQ